MKNEFSHSSGFWGSKSLSLNPNRRQPNLIYLGVYFVLTNSQKSRFHISMCSHSYLCLCLVVSDWMLMLSCVLTPQCGVWLASEGNTGDLSWLSCSTLIWSKGFIHACRPEGVWAHEWRALTLVTPDTLDGLLLIPDPGNMRHVATLSQQEYHSLSETRAIACTHAHAHTITSTHLLIWFHLNWISDPTPSFIL